MEQLGRVINLFADQRSVLAPPTDAVASGSLAERVRRAFGEEPGRIVAVGVMTDADNTQESGRCVYGDISFRRTSPQALTLN